MSIGGFKVADKSFVLRVTISNLNNGFWEQKGLILQWQFSFNNVKNELYSEENSFKDSQLVCAEPDCFQHLPCSKHEENVVLDGLFKD